jgi:hypothetical protein
LSDADRPVIGRRVRPTVFNYVRDAQSE